jgi:hypothetical protein
MPFQEQPSYAILFNGVCGSDKAKTGHSLITVIYAEYSIEVPKGDEGVDGRALYPGRIVHEDNISPLYIVEKWDKPAEWEKKL